jgi:hypothetical protein
MKKLALSLLLAIGLLVGSFTVTPAMASLSSDTTQASGGQEIEWVTYRDSRHDWSIQYPSDWTINVDDDSIPSTRVTTFFRAGAIIQVTVNDLSSFNHPYGEALLAASTIYPEETTEKVCSLLEEDLKEEARSRGITISRASTKRTNLNGVDATDREYKCIMHKDLEDTEMKSRSLVLINAGKVYFFFFTAPYISIFDFVNELYFTPMVQSFKFKEHKGGR